MSILSSSVFPSCQSKSQHHFPYLRPTTTPPNNFLSSRTFITSRNLTCPKIKLSVAASFVLHDDWPQLLQLSIGSDEITVLSVLQACSHSGLFDVGIHLFWNMESKFKIKPAIEHYACMVDLLGRSGSLSKAMEFIKQSAFSESPLLWRTLINTSNLHGDVKISTLASKHLLDLVPDDAGSYVLISNMYAGGGMFSDAARVRTLMNNRKMKKDAGCSWIEIENKVHRFFASGEYHQKSKEIYKKLDELRYLMKEKSHPDIVSLQTWDM